MKISVVNRQPQIFLTLQGEGPSLGESAIFIRTSGCNLFCWWCDTPFTWNWQGTPFTHESDLKTFKKYNKTQVQIDMSITEILDRIKAISNRPKRFVFTGGEPLLQQQELIELAGQLLDQDLLEQIEIETNGTIKPSEEWLKLPHQFNISPKLTNSKVPEKLRIKPKSLIELLNGTFNSYLKFVVERSEDFEQIEEFLKCFPYETQRIFIMPEGTTPPQLTAAEVWLRPLCEKSGFSFTQRMHILKGIP